MILNHKNYVLSIVFAILFVFMSPFFLFVMFMSGDSCCGQDMSAPMTVVAIVIITLLGIVSLIINFIYKRKNPEFNLIIGFLITTFPATLIYLSFLMYLLSSFK